MQRRYETITMQYRNSMASVCRARWVTRGVTAVMVLCATAWGIHAVWHPVTEAAVHPPRPTVRPLFDLKSPERSPFPSDVFTVTDASQNTGRRVNLPMR